MRNLIFAAVFSVLLAAPAMDAFAQAGTSFGAGSLGSNGDQDDQIFASGFEGSEAQTPMLVFVSPSAQNSVVSSAALLVDVLVTPAASPVVAVTINGTEANVGSVAGNGHHYLAEIALQDGQNRIVAEARFANDATIAAEIQVTYVGLAQITVTNPTDWETLGPLPGTSGNATNLTGAVQRAVTVSGTLNRPVERVEVNQQLAQLEASGKAFHFDEFLLREGANLISVNAIDAYGRISTANLTVYVDQTAPLLSVEGLASVTSANRIDVRGVVNDAVEGGLNAAEPRVTILNTANTQTTTAIASDRYYIAQDVPLELGNNTLRVTAVDQVGNARSREASVTRIAAGSPRVTLLGGNRQRARVSTQLPQPLAIAAIAPDGLPLAGIPIHFDVLRGSGHLSDIQGAIPRPDGLNPARHQVVNTDAAGRAQIWLTLGSEALEAGDSVRARSLDHSEEVTFTATGLRGEPFSVLVAGTAGTQYAQTLSQPVDAMGVVVLDRDNNPSISVPVIFRVSSGDAHFTAQSAPNGTPAQDGQSIVVSTDKNGMASVRPMTGEHAGVVEVVASATLGSGGSVGNAVLRLIVLERRDGPTSFSGIALDHSGAPLAGAIVSISRTNLSARSDATGKFRFEDSVPPGKIDVYIDGRDVRAQLGGQQLEYPALHFETAIIQGQANQLPHPIYLPPIDRSREKIVGGDSDVSLTMPELEGFEMIVKANSVTFPDGSRVGPMVVTRVNGDRLPMVPPGGYATFGAVAWTIQPTGARFDPPVEVRIPNVTGMQPGETNEIVQWDHDLATFVPMGRGTVSEDGTQLVTDAGSGITKAGWGGGPPPVTPNDGDNQCHERRNGEADECPCSGTATVTANSKETELFIALDPGNPVGTNPGALVNFLVVGNGDCGNVEVTWSFGDSTPTAIGPSIDHRFIAAGDYTVTLNVTCLACNQDLPPMSIRVVVFKVEIITAITPVFEVDITPTMPDVEFEVAVTPASIAAEISYDWFLETRFNQISSVPPRDDNFRFPESGVDTIAGATKWKPTWGAKVIVADVVKPTVEAYHSSNPSSKAKHQKDGYKILGRNPTQAETVAEVGMTPWFIGGIVAQESSFRQFEPSPGLPLWGHPNGWGIMMVENPPRDELLYNWRENVAEGVLILNNKFGDADAFWSRQVSQYEQYEADPLHPRIPVHPNVVEGPCVFSHNPAASEHSFRDAIWIKMYNGASKPRPIPPHIHSGMYLYWDNLDTDPLAIPYWQRVELNSENVNYVESVCDDIP